MAIQEKQLAGLRRTNITRGQNSRRGGQERRRSNSDLLGRARTGKLSTYGAALLARRKSMGGSGG